MTRGKRSNSVDSTNEKDIFFQCRGKKISVTEIADNETFSRFLADQIIKKHMMKNQTKVTICCLQDRLKFIKSTSIIPHSLRKYVYYDDIKNFLVFTSKPGIFMICIKDSETNKKTYESFCCDEPSDLDKLTRLVSSAKNNPNHRLYKSYNTSRSTIDMNNEISAAELFESSTNLNNESSSYQSGFLRDTGSPVTEAIDNHEVFHNSPSPFSPTHTYNNLTSVSMSEIPNEHTTNGYEGNRSKSNSQNRKRDSYNSPNAMIAPPNNDNFHPLIGYQSKTKINHNQSPYHNNNNDSTPVNSRRQSLQNLLRLDNENVYTHKDELNAMFDYDLTLLTSSCGDVYESEHGSKYLFCQSGLERLQTYEGPLYETTD
ncbi:hypothetical protein KSF78_0003657 [Schistosoma japonicum]|nr:hypothetical protein KSF78_0003657 [Schistosoma japonicum]KAH8867289.1 hypothetical protein KSF78_0003657 [Schistosoma japonicum]KAH8867290.1 hypothetical protein KSF78_0003657 [Schistosoma japonicum]